MYYLELIDRFWEFNHKNKLGSTVAAVYMYLLYIAKKEDSYYFTISDTGIAKELKLTRKTVRIAKVTLQKCGIIDFKSKNGSSGSYSLKLNYSMSYSEIENLEPVVLETAFSNQNEMMEASQAEQLANVERGENLEKEEEGNSQGYQLEADIRNAADSESQSFGIIEKNSNSNSNRNIPSFIEFLEYAKTLESYDTELDVLIQGKYSNWKDNGWMNNSGRPITNWKMSLKSTLPFLNSAMHAEFQNQKKIHKVPKIKRPDIKF